jgi:hypothetical protein
MQNRLAAREHAARAEAARRAIEVLDALQAAAHARQFALAGSELDERIEAVALALRDWIAGEVAPKNG